MFFKHNFTRSTSQSLLLCLPACGKPNTDFIIIVFGFFFHFLVFFFLLFDFTGPAGKCVTLSSKLPVHCSNIISPHWKVWLSKHPTKLIRHSEASHGRCVWFRSKPKGVFLDRQQVIPSANVGNIHPNRTNVKFTWCKHRITNEPSSCSEGTKCTSLSI